jgi:hypothetical protein
MEESELICVEALSGQLLIGDGEHWGYALASLQLLSVTLCRGTFFSRFFLVLPGVLLFFRLLSLHALGELVSSIILGRDMWPRSTEKSSYFIGAAATCCSALLLLILSPLIKVHGWYSGSMRSAQSITEAYLLFILLLANIPVFPLVVFEFCVKRVVAACCCSAGQGGAVGAQH